jgi:hypothetical protein
MAIPYFVDIMRNTIATANTGSVNKGNVYGITQAVATG